MKFCQERGNSIIEFTLLVPWLFFLFVGAMDWGFYADALIATESAARVAALYTSTSSTTVSDSNTACTYALGQLQKMSNVGNAGVTTCTGSPVVIAVGPVTGPDGASAAQVTVTYTTPTLIPMMSGQAAKLSITRTVQMKMRS